MIPPQSSYSRSRRQIDGGWTASEWFHFASRHPTDPLGRQQEGVVQHKDVQGCLHSKNTLTLLNGGKGCLRACSASFTVFQSSLSILPAVLLIQFSG